MVGLRFRDQGLGLGEVWALMWALRPFRGILETFKSTYRVYVVGIEDSRVQGPY